MRKYVNWTLVIGAGLLSSATILPSIGRADDPAAPALKDTREADKPLAFPAGISRSHVNPDEGIRSGLVKLTQRAVTKGDFNSMLGELSVPDRERAREFKGVDQSKLDAQIERINSAWKAKYGKDFSIDEKIVFGAPVDIIEGEVTDPAQAMANWPVPALPAEAGTASAKQTPAPTDKDVKKEAREQKLEQGRKVALVRFTEASGSPALTISMVHHLPLFWRIDIPNDRTGEQIYNDMLAQLTWIADHAEQWPTNVNEAGRVVGYHVLGALYGGSTTRVVAGKE